MIEINIAIQNMINLSEEDLLNQFIADYNAFLTGNKYNYQLEAMKEVHTIVLPKEAVEWG